jgi:Protein of unknown function (DUF3124)
MRKIIYIFCLIGLLFLSSCTGENSKKSEELTNNQPQTVIVDKNIKFTESKTVYVPIYSHIYYEDNDKSLDLAANLSIRNTDLSNNIIITSVRYYDTAGNLLREYLKNPIQLNKLATTYFVVERTDKSGGAGANFIVDWLAEKQVSEPIIEAVMITAGSQNISFISRGMVIKDRSKKSDITNNK